METIDFREEIDFGKYWRVIKRRWWVIILLSSSVFGLSILMTLRQDPVYQASGKLLFQTDKTSNLIGIETDTNVKQFEGLTQKSDPLSTQAELIRSQEVAQATIRALNLKDDEGQPFNPKVLADNLQVKTITGTDILQVAYNSEDPQLAANVVNQVMKAYLDSNVQANRAEAVAARKFIVDQLPESEAAVNQAEINLRQFREANGVIALDQEAISTVTGLSTLDQQITEAQAGLSQANAKASELRGQVGSDAQSALTLNSLSQSEGVQKALTELQLVQSQLAKQQTLYRGLHPAVTQLQRQEAAAKAVVEERVKQVVGEKLQVATGKLQTGAVQQDLVSNLAKAEVDRLSAARRLQSLTKSQSAYLSRSSSMPALDKTQRELQRQLDAAQSTYKTLLTKLQEVQISENKTIANARVVSAADVPDTIVSPRLLLNLLVGGVGGLLLGLAAAFLLDYADQSVRTLQEAKELFRYTLLGVIPTIGGANRFSGDQTVPKVISRDHPNFAAQEAYQMLHANLKFLASDKELKTIVVTSSVRKEGKSTIAANLAAAMAQVQCRVLLIDADLRHPCQHHVWNLVNRVGLSNLIVNQVNVLNAVQVVTSHLHVLTAGVIPPNPMALLDSKRMAALIELFAQSYDFVILDAPTLSGSADATVLNKMTDGSLLVVRPNTIKSSKGKAAKQFLAQSGQKVLGMVVNHFDVRKEPDSYFYFTKEDSSSLQKSDKSVRV